MKRSEEVAPSRTAARRSGTEEVAAGSPEDPAPFGKYLLLGKLARGGMAEVYRAKSASLVPPRLLAIKCMRENLMQESRFVEMFIREGKLAMLLEHPSIVQTYEVGNIEGRYFIAMEYLDGKDLSQLLKRCQETGRRLPIPHALYIARSVCQALQYAHTLHQGQNRPLNIVNRDVSPSNIRISYDGEVKLLDFGIAQALLQVTSEIGVLKGKFSYMSPEQIRGLPIDCRSDIFSTGIVLHEMLTCTRLFKDESEFVLMEMVRRAEVKPPSAFNPRVPPEFDAIVLRALQREPDARYQEAANFAEDLTKLLTGYQFTHQELGEFTRGLFAVDCQQDQAIARSCLTLAPSEVDHTRRFSPQKKARGEGSPQRKKDKTAAETALGNQALWAAAVVLLLAGIVLLVLALR